MSWYKNAKSKAEHLVQRGLDKHVRVAVTGLSGAGKTAFITSFINQLLYAPGEEHLTFFAPCREGRLLVSKLALHEQLHIPAFDYLGSIKSITAEDPSWPASTRSTSQANIQCRFMVKDKWLSQLTENSFLTIEILDYPGEWLLDLPLLSLSFKEWSQLCLQYLESERRKPFVSNVFDKLSQLQYNNVIDEAEQGEQLGELANEYKNALHDYRKSYNDFSLALPGRFLLPGELKDSPALSFFPVISPDILNLDWEQFESHSVLKVLERRYNYYQKHIIRPFFEEYFSKVDRQIVLLDTIAVLQSDYDSYQDLKETIERLLVGFSYGRSNWLKRLFSPSIDKLMIATTKADLVPPDQHASLESFMQKIVTQIKNEIGYDGVDVETMAIASVATSVPVTTEHNGEQLLCVKGLDDKSGESVIHYPGKVPAKTLSREEWRRLTIDFSPFALPELNPDDSLPHIRMDKVLQFLIGDKFV
ncbi:YcjX family protein [Kangiella japonica]|uniref:YcjX family protein n=1 Tax=Kangiella japonica TaxID=647384 RepID=A0ABP3CFV4_9GAMM